jgi:hypothetical protein
MRAVGVFWAGVAVAGAFFVFTGGTGVDLEATAADPRGIVVTGRVDQGTFARLFAPASPVLGTVRVTKREWGLLTTYTEEITVLGAQLAAASGGPLSVQVKLEVPGTVIGTNATAREGRTLVWSALPADGPLWVQSRAVHWPAAACLAAALALTFRMRAR